METAKEILDLGRRVHVIKADVSEEDDVRSMLEYITAKSASSTSWSATRPPAAFGRCWRPTRATFRTRSIPTCWRCCTWCRRRCRCWSGAQGRAKVIALSSHGSDMALPWYGLIGSSKAALESLARHLTLEVGDRGVNVNVVKSGLVETDSTRRIPGAEEMFAHREDKTMTGDRMLTIDDVANAVLFLASPLADLIQGETLTVDGGAAIHV